jgi:hypothetical protein
VNNVKNVWGSQPAGGASTEIKPNEAPTSNYDQNKVKVVKKEPPKPKVDEKKEQMKNALFSGISGGATKKDSDSDEEE